MRPADILTLLPDTPRWIGVRGILSSGRGGPVGPVARDPLSLVVLRPETGTAAVVGRPPAADIQSAAAQAEEVLAGPDDAAWVRSALPAWESEPATLHVLGEPWSAGSGPSIGARVLTREDVSSLGHLPGPLASELDLALARGFPIGAVFSEGEPVAFCCADSVTESLWDVSVETLEDHRRRGFAAMAARFMIDFYARGGKRPVWGSAASNPASAALALKLGFVPVDRLWVFTPAQGV